MDANESRMLSVANVNAKNKDHMTPLHYGALYGHRDIVKMLIDAGANVDAENCIKRTPLHYCALNGHKAVAEVLIFARANINAEDIKKWTPLHCCASNGHTEVIKIIIMAGSDKSQIYINKETSLKQIISAAKIDAEDINKQTPLHFSASNGHKESVEVLISFGANINAKDKDEYTPLHYCAMKGHSEVVKILTGLSANVEQSVGRTPICCNRNLNGHENSEDVPIADRENCMTERLDNLAISPSKERDQMDKQLVGATVASSTIAPEEPMGRSNYADLKFDWAPMKFRRVENLTLNVTFRNENIPNFIPASIVNANLVNIGGEAHTHYQSYVSDID